MKRNLRYVWVLMLLGVVSCQKNDLNSPKAPGDQVAEAITLTADEAERLPLFESDYNRSLEEVLAIANGLAEQMAKEERQRTKAATVPTRMAVLTDSIVIAFPATKSTAATQMPDQAKIYVVNFGDNAGYTLIAGDKRVTSDILAYSESSHFDVQTDNPGAQLAMEYMQSYMQDEIVRLEAMRGDSVYTALQARYGFGAAHAVGTDGYTPQTKSFQQPPEFEPMPGLPGSSPDNPYGTKQGSNWQVVQNGIIWYWAPVDQIVDAETNNRQDIMTVVHPLVPSQWGQRWPYNSEVLKKHPDCPAGCMAIAMAQIMAYHKKPTGYLWNDFGYNVQANVGMGNDSWAWENKSIATIQSIGKLCLDLGTSLGLNYKPTGTGRPNSDNVPAVFRSYGYFVNGLQSFNNGQLEIDIQINKRPVYVSGFTLNREGHAWIVDGFSQLNNYDLQYKDCYYQGERVGHIKVYTTRYETNEKYYHCNWGWNGDQDGWFLTGTFNPRSYDFVDRMVMISDIR